MATNIMNERAACTFWVDKVAGFSKGCHNPKGQHMNSEGFYVWSS
jgi:hypothetical protein